jgi:hypothetical protein
VDATTQAFGRLAAALQASGRRLFPQALLEMRLQGAARRARRVVRERRGQRHLAPHPELRDAAERQVSEPQLAEPRWVVLQPEVQRTARREFPQDAAAEQRRDEQHPERQPAKQLRFQRQVQRQRVLEQ